MFVNENSRPLSRALAALAVALAAVAASPAAAQQTTIDDGPAATSGPLCPGGSSVTADYFTAASTGANEYIKRVRVIISPPGAFATIDRVEIKNSAGTVTYASVAAPNDQFDVVLIPTIAVTGAAVPYRIDVTPKPRASMPASSGGVAVSVKVLDVAVSYKRTVSDPNAATLTLDNVPPADIGWTTMLVTTSPSNQISVAFRPPSEIPSANAGVVVLRRAGQPVTDVPALGATLASIGAVGANFGSSQVRFNGAAAPWSFTDSGAAVVAGTSYYYRAYVRDSCGNWSAGESVGPVYMGIVTEGDPAGGSTKPMVGILNPSPGVVTSPFKVQVRVYSPKKLGVAQPILGAPTLTLKNSGGTTTPYNLVRNDAYGTATDSGVFEPSPVLSIAAGSYTLVANAANGSGNTNSATIAIVVGAGRGDGNLLVRDNSSQLCNDCHALPTHSSESTTNKYGQWYTGCRSCHQPHGTANASLVGTEVVPPQVAGQLPPTKVYFSKRTGFDPAAGATNTVTMSAATFANGDRTGPCQACHTRTSFYTRAGATGDGGPGNHYTQKCTDCHKHKNGFGASCTSCHGTLTPRTPATANADSLLNVAPPRDTAGNIATTFVGVGAHEKHVNATTWRTDPILCAECHAIPNTHNGTVELPFNGVLVSTSYDWAGGAGPTPTWDKPTAKCSNTYCHGNFRGGDNLAQPIWTAANSVQCGSCHGRGGTDPRPANAAHSSNPATCSGCHAAAYSMTTVDKTKHMNGALDASGCDGCHGEPTRTASLAFGLADAYVRPMPPHDALAPRSDLTTDPGVGAHLKHVDNTTSLATTVACEECHGTLPTDTTHVNGTVALSWGALATNGSTVVPTRVGQNCTNYCHGTAAMGGAYPAGAVWTQVDGTFKTCGSCHGAPPPVTDGGHPQDATCGRCHTGYSTPATVVQSTHINRAKNANTSTGCARCHGSLQDAVAAGNVNTAPGLPGTFDAHGNASTVTSAKGVGAHRAHLASALSNAIACTACHPSPNYSNTTHADNVAAVPFPAGLANTQLPGDPTVPAPSYANPSCTSVYCHGQFQGGKGPSAAPVWNAASLTAMTCTSCHGAPPVPAAAAGGVPASYHPNNSACGGCHTGYTSSSVASVKATHVDGVLQRVATTGCAQCHGAIADGVAATSINAAPGVTGAVDSKGSAANLTANAGVGAHKAHLQPRYMAAAIACTQCHPSYADKTHADGAPAMSFNPSLAATVLAGDLAPTTPTYAGAGGACNNTYCHGRFSGGAGTTTPNWAVAGYTGVSMTCTSCHGNPPTGAGSAPGSRSHPNNTNCGSTSCHGAGYSNTAVNTALHINGRVDQSSTSCTACHGTTRSGTGADPFISAAPPVDSATNNATTLKSVGVHVEHVQGTRSKAVWCQECHRGEVPGSTQYLHANGSTLIDASHFGTIATANYTLSPTYSGGANPTCSATYCHGNFVGGAGTGATPAWTTKATLACTSCHGNPPAPRTVAPISYHPNNSACGNCHTGYTNALVQQATHVDGLATRTVTTGCAQCHGKLGTANVLADSTDAAPGVAAGSVDSRGNTLTSAVGVGAHAAHLVAGGLKANALACTDCHPAYANATHADGATGFSWGALATSRGRLAGSITYTSSTCSNTYCHAGPTAWAAGTYAGTNPTPTWNLGATETSCGSCHKVAPTNTTHTAANAGTQNCSACHSGYNCLATNLPACTVNTTNHINGVANVPSGCDGCHGAPPPVTVKGHPQNPVCQNCHGAGYATIGPSFVTTPTATHGTSPGNGATIAGVDKPYNTCRACHGVLAGLANVSEPVAVSSVAPGYYNTATATYGVDTLGSTTTQNTGVGAHDAHVRKTNLRQAELACTQCHFGLVPPSGNTAHADGSAATAFDPALAASAGAVTWNGVSCNATYCHGNFTNGNAKYVAPAAPGQVTGLAFSNVGPYGLTLTWTALAGAWGYKVERATASGGPWYQVGATPIASFTEVDSLAANTTYWFRVTAWNPGGNGTTSTSASRLTAAASGFTGAVAFDAYPWTTVTSVGVDGDITITGTGTFGFSTTPDTNRTWAQPRAGRSATASTWRQAGLAANTWHHIASLYTPPFTRANNVVGTTAIPTIVYTRSRTANVTYQVHAEFYEYDDVTGNDPTLLGTTGIQLSVGGTADGAYTQRTMNLTLGAARTIGAGHRLKVMLKVRPNVTQEFQMGFGQTTAYASFTPTLSAQSFAIPTTAPASLTATATGSFAIALSWPAVSSALTYKIQRSPDGSTGWTQVGQTAGTTFADRTLSAGTPYWYRVLASNPAGDAAVYSPVATDTTAPTPSGSATWAGSYAPGSSTLTCGSCHGNPPMGTHPAGADACSSCHEGYDDNTASPQNANKAVHMNGVINVDCQGCHSQTQGTRADIVAEFANPWSHKASDGGKVTKWDCIVCHMEGNPADGERSSQHANSTIELRDPDTGNQITGVTFDPANGTTAGSYRSNGTAFSFAQFSRTLNVTLEADANRAIPQAIMINQCLKCHDANGAQAYTGGRSLEQMATKGGLTRTAGHPFGTSITRNTNYAGGSGYTACGLGDDGCVANIDASFAVSNSSYHPIKGKNNNWYARQDRMRLPWNITRTPASVPAYNSPSWGTLMSCWDCHAPNGRATDGTPLTRTVTAHGGTSTVRGTTWANPAGLCNLCHIGNVGAQTQGNHGTNSALGTASSTNSGMQTYIDNQCHYCHSSNQTRPARPIAAQDVHGVNDLPAAGTKTGRWSTGTDKRPYAFIRNTAMLTNHQPTSIKGVSTGGATCAGVNTGVCNDTMGAYSPGGVY